MKKETSLQIITGILAALFFYASLSKLLDYKKAKEEMMNQVFPASIAEVFTWLIPTIEILLVILLLNSKTRKIALQFSLALLTLFTLYITVVMTGIFGRIPCSCGGILNNMSYGVHILFNLFFIMLATVGLALEYDWKAINRWFNSKTERSLP